MISGSLHYLLKAYTSLINQIISQHCKLLQSDTDQHGSRKLFMFPFCFVYKSDCVDGINAGQGVIYMKKNKQKENISLIPQVPSSDSLHRLTHRHAPAAQENI